MPERNIDTMTLEQTRAAARELLDSTTGDLAGADAERFTALTRHAEALREQQCAQDRQFDRDLGAIRAAAGGGDGWLREGDHTRAPVHDQDNDAPPLVVRQRDSALRVLDRAVSDDRLHARGAGAVETLMRTGSPLAQGWTRRWAIAAGDPDYETAFAKLLTVGAERAHLEWTRAEADAFRRVQEVRAEQRAMSTTDSAGGYLLPLIVDPAVNLTNAGSTNPLREIARVEMIATEAWHGVNSAGVQAEWLAEADEAADGSPTLAQPRVPAYKGSCFVPFSVELEGDGANLMQELSRLLLDGATQLTNVAYTVGSGTGQPTGVVPGVVGADAGAYIVSGTGSEALAAADFFKVQNALGARFQPNARWMMNLSTKNTAIQFETTNGALKFPTLQENPPTLLGRPVHENSSLDGVLNTAATEANYLAVYGDFAAGFLICDRVGSSIELVPHLVGSNRRPTGQRGAWLWFRTGSDAIVPSAFRVLNVPTSA